MESLSTKLEELEGQRVALVKRRDELLLEEADRHPLQDGSVDDLDAFLCVQSRCASDFSRTHPLAIA